MKPAAILSLSVLGAAVTALMVIELHDRLRFRGANGGALAVDPVAELARRLDRVEARISVPTAIAPRELDSQCWFAEISKLGDSWGDVQAAWKSVYEARLQDEVIALFETYASAHASDATAQVELGNAYLQRVFHAGGSLLEESRFATKADAAYDAALALDDHHEWARLQKAVSLSYWPPILGKQRLAIEQLELLVEQQRGHPLAERHVQTYLWLGDIHRQMGNEKQAIAAWQSGASLFPQDRSLQSRLATVRQN